jgi:acetolactate synthase-1/2/3 large subunit
VVERWNVPVITTPAGRGVLPEDHPLALRFDGASGNVTVINELLQRADHILALGCKLSHNGTAGFSLVLSPDRLVHVDTAAAVLNASYPAHLTVQGSAEQVLDAVRRRCERERARASGWPEGELTMWRDRLRSEAAEQLPEPRFPDLVDGTAAGFFRALRNALQNDGVLVTDSGMHQFLARRHFEVRAPQGLIFPNDFQAMGYGLPAAIGAQLAAAERRVVLVIGDGGLLMSGMELVTAVRERVPLTVIVFHDGKLNHIRLQQLAESGHAHDVSLHIPNLAMLAEAMGMRYVRLAGDAEPILTTAFKSAEPVLIEVRVGDSPAIRLLQAKAATRRAAPPVRGPRLAAWIKQRLSRPTQG